MTGPLALPGDQCQVHGWHRPPVLESERHHVHPLYLGGPNVPENLVNICPTGHASVHVVLRALVAGRTPPKSTRRERQLAEQGHAAWVLAGRPKGAT